MKDTPSTNSPFTGRFGTNYAPTDDELEQIAQLLVEPLDQRNVLDAEISRLQRVIDELSVKRNLLTEFITSHQTLLSPIRRIPLDVLREIFVRCLPTDHNAIMSCREAPLLLGRVCSSWRSNSTSTPKLWSSIHISVPDPGPWRGNGNVGAEDTDVFLQAITVWLNRSGALPLSISLFYSYLNEVEDHIFPRLIAVSDRWKHINLSLSLVSIRLIASISKEQLPLLESCSIHLPSFIGMEGKNIFQIFHAPRLRRLLIPNSLATLVGVLPNWSRLSEIIIVATAGVFKGLHIDTALAIMRHCDKLVACRMDISDDVSADAYEHPTAIVPGLKWLTIHGGCNLGPLFDRLHLPTLLSLDLTIIFGQPSFNHHSLCAFLSRSKALDSLTLNSSAHTGRDLLECVTRAPNISQLILRILDGSGWGAAGTGANHFPVDDQLLGLLTPTTDGPVNRSIWPRLKVIECNPSGASDDVLLNFIQARTTLSSTHGVAHLDRINFNFRREKDKDIFPVLSRIISAGTEVILTYNTSFVYRRSVNPRAGVDHLPVLKTLTYA
jgi:hypothetical protein